MTYQTQQEDNRVVLDHLLDSELVTADLPQVDLPQANLLQAKQPRADLRQMSHDL